MSVKKSADRMGFSGISDLASDVHEFDGIIEEIVRKSNYGKKISIEQKSSAPPLNSERYMNDLPSPLDAAGKTKNGAPKSVSLLYIVAIFIAVIIMIGIVQNKAKPYYPPRSSSQRNNASSPSFSQENPNRRQAPQNGVVSRPPLVAENPIPSSLRQGSLRPSQSIPTSKSLKENELLYAKPIVGSGNVLSISEIRWCIREDIRLEAMRNVDTSDSWVDTFNALVDDYNSRCGSYRYRQGDLKQARHEVEKYREQIIAEAIQTAKLTINSQQFSTHTSFPVLPSTDVPAIPNVPSKPSINIPAIPSTVSNFSQNANLFPSPNPISNNAKNQNDIDSNFDIDSLSSPLLDTESRIAVANRLRQKGIFVDWRRYSLSQLLKMESGK